MKKLLTKQFIFFLPIVLILIVVFFLDPFRVFFYYEDFYTDNMIGVNREMVCLKLFDRNNEEYKYDSFIFGSSRSRAFKIENWIDYLPKDSEGFHFDAAGDGIYGIYNKLRYIDEVGNNINNALIIIDDATLSGLKNREGHLYISPPELSKLDSFPYYSSFIKASLNPKFLIGYCDYKIFETHRPYMGSSINKPKYNHRSNNISGDFYYSYDKMIEEDEEGYYKNLQEKGVFYDRSELSFDSIKIDDEESKILIKIQEILEKHNTDYYIIVSPLYDQRPFNYERMNKLKEIFNEDRIYDFSGENEFTASVYNYYEDSHYRTHIANEIIDIIYWQN